MDKPTVLVVDDDPDIVAAVTLALEDEGYRPLQAIGTAVLRLAEETPAVVLMDVMMPVVNGAKLTRLLRANPLTAAIPIVRG